MSDSLSCVLLPPPAIPLPPGLCAGRCLPVVPAVPPPLRVRWVVRVGVCARSRLTTRSLSQWANHHRHMEDKRRMELIYHKSKRPWNFLLQTLSFGLSCFFICRFASHLSSV